MARCKTCRHRKWQRHLNTSQQLRSNMADMLLEDHEPSCTEKRKMQMEIVAEFCRLGKTDIHETCVEYGCSRWRFWARSKS